MKCSLPPLVLLAPVLAAPVPQGSAPEETVTAWVHVETEWKDNRHQGTGAHMPFEIFVQEDPVTRRVLLEGETDRKGHAILRFTYPRELLETLQVSPSKPGVQARSRPLVPFKPGAADDLVAKLDCRAGHTTFGRLIDADGRAVEGVLTLGERAHDVRDWSHELPWKPSGRPTRADGGFDLHTAPETRADAPVQVVARALGVGTASAVLEADPAPGSGSPLILTLRGSAVFRGRLMGTDGRPLPAVRLELESADPRGEEPGLRRVQVVSGPDGTFSATHLAPGSFHVRTCSQNEAVRVHGLGDSRRGFVQHTRNIVAKPVPADGEERDVVARGDALVVTLTRPDGAAFEGPIHLVEPAYLNTPPFRLEPSSRPRLRVTGPDGLQLFGVHDGLGHATFFPAEKGPLVVEVEGFAEPAAGFVARRHTLEPGEGTTRFELRAQAPAPYGQLRFEVRRRFEGQSEPRSVRLYPDQSFILTDLDTGTSLTLHPRYAEEPHHWVPAGRYSLRVNAAWSGPGPAPAPMVSRPILVDAGAGASVDVTIDLCPAAYLQPLLDGEAPARLWLVDEHGARIDVLPDRRRLSRRPNSALMPDRVYEFPPEKELRSRPLSPGAFRLRGTVGARVIDRAIELAPGECLEVALRG